MHALASFMNAVKMGRVPAGSFLVVESLDRLSREKIRPALTLLLNLIEAGVKVVQLLPIETVYDEDVEPMALLQAIMELNRGHSESKVKSERVGSAWARKRREAATRIVTRRLPGWIRHVNGKLDLDPQGAETVRRVFALALAGNGVAAIALALNAEGVPVMGRKVFQGRPVLWNSTVVYHVLTSRATYGEFQPHTGRAGKREPQGDPVPNYFPAVIDKDTFLAAEAARKSRTQNGAGRRGKHVNLFAGLLIDARDGGSLTYKHLSKRPATIIPVSAKQGRGTRWSSFPAVPLETAIRSMLVEIKATEIQDDNGAARKAEVLAGKVVEIDTLTRAWRAKMDNPAIVDVVATKLAELAEQRKVLAEELAEVQREAASPLAEAWGTFRTLAGLKPAGDTDDLRVRIKAALRRTVEGIWCLFVSHGRKSDRLAAVQVWFKSGACRNYLIRHRQPRANSHGWRADGIWQVWSLADVVRPGDLDLRDRAHAEALEKRLQAFDLSALPE
jgi:DNA invertase Pin-like site-specific DNA recombinase